jgi:hypothetical protein
MEKFQSNQVLAHWGTSPLDEFGDFPHTIWAYATVEIQIRRNAPLTFSEPFEIKGLAVLGR